MVMSQESSHSPKIHVGGWGWWWAVGLGVATAAYGLAFRRYGVELADEGALLAHMDRILHGQVPYRDFHVGYGPALYWLHVPLLVWCGTSIATVRTALALVHGVRATLAARLAADLGGRGWGAVAVVVLVGFFLPVAPGVCAPGNIPYPAWYADALGLVAVLLLARGRVPLVVVGILWGVVFAFKQNTGLLGVSAAAATVVLVADPDARAGRGLGIALAFGLLAGVMLLLHELLDALLIVVFLVPLAPLLVALATARRGRATALDVVRLGVGFVAVAGSVVAVMIVRAGAGPVATDFLQIGTDTMRVYHVAHPTPATVLRDLGGADVPRAVRIVGDAVWFAIFPLVHLVATALVAAGRVRGRAAVAVVAAAALGYLDLFPRMDFWHLLPLAPVSLAAAALVATSLGPAIGRGIAIVLAVVAAGRAIPAFAAMATVLAAPSSPPPVPRVDVRWDLVREESLRRFPDVVAAVRGRGRIAGFPALGLVNFAIGEPSPWRHDYFFPGRPTAEEERALVAATIAHPPDAVVVLDAPEGAFAEAAAAHPAIVDMLAREFVEAQRIGPYRVLVPRRAP